MPHREVSSAKASVDSRRPGRGTLAVGVVAGALVVACVPEGPPTGGRQAG